MWRPLGLGLLAFGAGRALYACRLLVRRAPTVPALADGGLPACPAAVGLGFLRFRRRHVTRLEAFRLAVAVFTATVGVFAWKYMLYGVLSAYAATPIAAVTGLTYPFGDLILLSLLMLDCLIIADQAFIVLGANGTYTEGSWVDLFWSGASPCLPSCITPPDRPSPIATPYLPYVASGAALALLISGGLGPSPVPGGVRCEGLQTPAQLVRMRELGCERTQGFLLGHPVSPGRIPA